MAERESTIGSRARPISKGYFALPTVFANASNDWRLAREEIFGAVTGVAALRRHAGDRAPLRVASLIGVHARHCTPSG